MPEVAVLGHTADRAGMQRLEVEGTDPGDPHDRVAVQLPGDGSGSEEPGIGRGIGYGIGGAGAGLAHVPPPAVLPSAVRS
ncbi:hypothetical protein Y717_22855 [Streptomyces scopuliridis RB72]|uniref:Uncharacterized protein n=1 Tax=Streptomyces scopuliridis RB72 TaxID=1440053 RepID=A0A2T7TD90_9ACTN|nr:hypothetical protein Y717_22855 [Streptomyces scopuliridis RB72]